MFEALERRQFLSVSVQATQSPFTGTPAGVNQIIQAEAQLNNRSEPTREGRQVQETAEKVKQGLAFLPENDNHVHLKSADRGPVRVFAIVGDTGGPDISNDNDPKDDTRINSIVFKKLRIRLQ